MRYREICETANVIRKGRHYIRRVQSIDHLTKLLKSADGFLRGWATPTDLWVWEGAALIHSQTKYDVPDHEVPVYVYLPGRAVGEIDSNDRSMDTIETPAFNLTAWSPTGRAIERLRGIPCLRDLIAFYRPPTRVVEGRHEPDRLEHALWWLQRWISGSMDDPDWSWPEAESMTLEQAFDIIGRAVGNSRSIDKPVLWRSLILPRPVAQRVVRTRVLPPNRRFPYQSFSGSRDVAVEFGAELHQPEGSAHVLVSISPDTRLIPFGMADLLASKNAKVASWLDALDHWHHQDEVLVHVTAPLPLLSAEIVAD